jgi:hypothetical protein
VSVTNPIYQEDGLYNLLPAIYRNRDAELGYPLRALLRAIATQLDTFSAEIAQQYQNWFIETCQDDLVPYFAQLIALDLGPALPSAAGSDGDGADAIWRRREVADAVADRRRKGSFSVLEQLAFDATGWPARAIEYGAAVLATRSLRFPAAGRRRLLNLHDGDQLDVLGTALGNAAPLADVRRISSHRTPGTGGPGGVAVWLWRLVADQVQQAPARVGAEGNRLSFDQLGRELALAVSPTPRQAGATPVLDLDVPVPITRVALRRRIEDYYGPGLSLCIYRGRAPVPRREIVVANLQGWRHSPEPGRVALDPELGRIAFPARHAPEEAVSVTYSRLTVGAIGGGSYTRPLAATPPGATVYTVGRGAHHHRTITGALAAWSQDRKKHPPAAAAVIEIQDDGVYEERIVIELVPGEQLVIRAAQGRRPVVIPIDDREDFPDRLLVTGAAPPKQPARRGAKPDDRPPAAAPPGSPAPPDPAPLLTLDGIWIGGGRLELHGRLGTVTITHCTLVPASGARHLDPAPDRRTPSLVVKAMPCRIVLASAVVGRIEVESPEAGHDPIPLDAADSVLDASRPDGWAIEAADGRRAFVSLGLTRVTVLGGAYVDNISVVVNSIVTHRLLCERRQTGALRFSYVPLGSRTPKPTRCQPERARAAIEDAIERGVIPGSQRDRRLAEATARVAPRFDATGFGAPAYARLSLRTAPEIARGADDEGELGAYHDRWEAVRIEDLRSRLREFSPAGIDIDTRLAT